MTSYKYTGAQSAAGPCNACEIQNVVGTDVRYAQQAWGAKEQNLAPPPLLKAALDAW